MPTRRACSPLAQPQQGAAQQAARGRGRNGRRASAVASAERLRLPLLGRQAGEVDDRQRSGAGSGGSTTATARPRRSTKLVRSDSWRRTISVEAAVRAATSSVPSEAHAARQVVGEAPGLEPVQEPEPLLGERERQRAVARHRHERRRLAEPLLRAAPARPAAAKPASVGSSKRARSGRAPRRALRGPARSSAWRAASARPARRSCRAAPPSRRPSRSAQMPASSSSTGLVSGDLGLLRGAPHAPAAGRARRSTLPVRVSGRAGSVTNADGTM